MSAWEITVSIWNWVDFALTLLSLAMSGYALYRQWKGISVVDTAITFSVVPVTLVEVELEPVWLPDYVAAAIHFPEMEQYPDVKKAFRPINKDVPTNFSVTLDIASDNLLGEPAFIRMDKTSFPIKPSSTSSTSTMARLTGNQHMNLTMIWKKGDILDEVLAGTIPFEKVFPQFIMSFLCFE